MMIKRAWDARIKRAEELGRAYPFASEVLRFYAQIARFQKGLYAYAESACGTQIEKKPSGSLRDELDLIVLLPKFPAFLSLIESAGTPQLAQTASELASAGHDRWIELLTGYWTSNGQGESAAENPNVFFMRAFLQPYGEYLADHTERAPPGAPPLFARFAVANPRWVCYVLRATAASAH